MLFLPFSSVTTVNSVGMIAGKLFNICRYATAYLDVVSNRFMFAQSCSNFAAVDFLTCFCPKNVVI